MVWLRMAADFGADFGVIFNPGGAGKFRWWLGSPCDALLAEQSRAMIKQALVRCGWYTHRIPANRVPVTCRCFKALARLWQGAGKISSKVPDRSILPAGQAI